MVKRESAASNDGDDELPPTKRPRVSTISSPPQSLLNLNNDCLLLILSNLHYGDLNSLAMTCRRLQELRNHESLDQTREGTIVISEGCDVMQLWDAIEDNRWNDNFQDNQRILNIVGAERLPREFSPAASERFEMRDTTTPAPFFLTGVEKVIISDCSLTSGTAINFICRALPNLRDLSINNLPGYWRNRVSLQFTQHIRPFGLSTLRWQGANQWINGFYFQCWPNLVELDLDNSRFEFCNDTFEPIWSSERYDTSKYLLNHCRSLQRVSIKNATTRNGPREDFRPLPQAFMIKMVRHHPTLRWLRSDLTAENIAMLRQERPEVELISE